VRRLTLGLLFIGVLLTVLVLGHAYVLRRLVLDTDLPQPWRSVAGAGILLLAASLVLEPVAQRLLPRRLARWIAWPASLWLGFAFLLLCALLASELVVWATGAPAQAAPAPAGAIAEAARTRALSVLGIVAALGALALRGGLRAPGVERVEHPLARWPAALDGFRIVQISDLHIGPLLGRRFARDVVERVNALAPDLIAVTGDLVDGSERLLRDEVQPFAELRARCGVFFVTGNHDYFSGVDAWVERAAALGMRPLRNACVAVDAGAAVFDLAGVEDAHAHLVEPRYREDVAAALEGRDPDRAVVLLAHDPATFRRSSRAGVDLQLSGHTHGGQIWPFRYLVRLAVPFLAGVYERSGARLYVSRGSGFWGPPMRLLSPAEITEHVLRARP